MEVRRLIENVGVLSLAASDLRGDPSTLVMCFHTINPLAMVVLADRLT